MREESHLDDMRSAIRGDFERLAERCGGQELMREPEHEPQQKAEHARAEPVEPEPVESEPVEPEAVLGHVEPPEEMPAAPEEAPPDDPPRRSLLDRLLGR